MSQKNKAVVLLSGGLDSATTLAIARQAGFGCCAMTFRYGQRHEVEIDAARRVAAAFGVLEHRIIDIDLGQFGGSALTDSAIEVPKDRDGIGAGIPITYVPARNLIFLSCATAWAEVLGVFDIFIGVNATDYSGYPDCRGEFIESFQQTANLATVPGTATVHDGRQTSGYPFALGSARVPGLYVHVGWPGADDRPKGRTLF